MPKRVDANQPEIVAALRQCGARVAHTHTVGKGFPDLVCGYRGRVFLLEVKDGSKSASRRKLTPDEQEFHSLWDGYVYVVNDSLEALRVIGAI